MYFVNFILSVILSTNVIISYLQFNTHTKHDPRWKTMYALHLQLIGRMTRLEMCAASKAETEVYQINFQL